MLDEQDHPKNDTDDVLERHEDDYDDDDEDMPYFDLSELVDGPDLQEGNARICIAEKTISDLQEVLAFANDHGETLSIEESVIEKAQVGLTNIPVAFEESTFANNLEWSDGDFKQELQFWDVSFEGKADFSRAQFHSKVRFEDCEFCADTSFAGTTFEKDVSFVLCEFDDQVSFDRARFEKSIDFSQSAFQKKVRFEQAFFSQTVDLENVEFKDGYDATGSNLQVTATESQSKPKAPQRSAPRKTPKIGPQKTGFNPWRELDRVSKKDMSRRQLLRGIFRFLPEKKED